MVHRLLEAVLAGPAAVAALPYTVADVSSQAETCNERKAAAKDAQERCVRRGAPCNRRCGDWGRERCGRQGMCSDALRGSRPPPPPPPALTPCSCACFCG